MQETQIILDFIMMSTMKVFLTGVLLGLMIMGVFALFQVIKEIRGIRE